MLARIWDIKHFKVRSKRLTSKPEDGAENDNTWSVCVYEAVGTKNT